MSPQYLVELRIGPAHWRIRHTTEQLARVHGIEACMERSPHLTLYGPCKLGNTPVRAFMDAIGVTASTYDWIPFRIRGWEIREGLNGWVIAYTVEPSRALRDLRYALSSRLSSLTETENAWDRDPSRAWFHVTAANRLAEERAWAIWHDLAIRQLRMAGDPCGRVYHSDGGSAATSTTAIDRPPYIEQDALRITVLEGESIMAEYDLLEKCWLPAEAAQDPGGWQRTLRQYRRRKGLELTSATGGGDGAYLISDTHFGHANIIRYCARPFVPADVGEMDAVLIHNWNRTVDAGDTVYFLGDLRYGTDAAAPDRYLQALNGRISFIAGNHDTEIGGTVRSLTLERDGKRFLLLHDPCDAPPDFEGWIVHGHMHNNDLENYPFIHFTNRTINVSAEVIAYSPIALSTLCRLIDEAADAGSIPTLQSLSSGF
ncbi:MAG: 2'-5' RNA ligase family protein [Methanomicrobiales archaeon]|nr:2'-5' RNA ligase family protein [Methanomicrobiales archaeon]MDI6876388.1 2'-5' RNA ligase family protein [Methanomicrobiales archaeon]